MRENDPIIGQFFTNRNMLLGAIVFFVVLLIALPTSPGQAAYAAFFLGVFIFQYALSRRQLDGLIITRTHRPRVFEGNTIDVALSVGTSRAVPVQMLQLEDQF